MSFHVSAALCREPLHFFECLNIEKLLRRTLPHKFTRSLHYKQQMIFITFSDNEKFCIKQLNNNTKKDKEW